VINKREDSYHTIESIFVPITWCDEISIECTHDGVISREGDLVSDLNDDLLIKAARLLKIMDSTHSNICVKKSIIKV